MARPKKLDRHSVQGSGGRLIVRVDLEGASPPIWRRLELRSELGLDQLHMVIQVAFGWQDSHLHEFSKVKPDQRRDVLRFVPQYLLDDGDLFEDAIDEATVDVGSLLVKPKDVIDYLYDFGDSWEHELRLERVVDTADDHEAASCLDGRQAAPPDDSGGMWGYQWLIEVGSDPAHPEFGEAREQLDWIFGEDATFDPEAFDLERINLRLKKAAASHFRSWQFLEEER